MPRSELGFGSLGLPPCFNRSAGGCPTEKLSRGIQCTAESFWREHKLIALKKARKASALPVVLIAHQQLHLKLDLNGLIEGMRSLCHRHPKS